MANNAYEDVKSFVSGPALHQSFSRIKTWTSSQISSAITTHNSNKTHVPVCSTAGTYKFLKGVANGAPTWSDIPTSSAINSNTNDTLATSAAVNALNNNKINNDTSLIKHKKLQINDITVAAGTYAKAEITYPAISGYTEAFIGGITGSGNGHISYSDWYDSNGKIIIYLHNNSSNSVTVTWIQVYVYYVRTANWN